MNHVLHFQKATRTQLWAGSGRNRQAIVLLFLVSSTERMHLKVREIFGKQLNFLENGDRSCVALLLFFLLLLCIIVFFDLCSELCLIVVVVPLPQFRSSSFLFRLELEQWSSHELTL